MPSIFITDRGREFVNQLSAELFFITRREHRITSAYHPQVKCNEKWGSIQGKIQREERPVATSHLVLKIYNVHISSF